MRHPSYIAILGMRDPYGARRMLEERAAATGLNPVLKTEGMAVFCDRPPNVTLPAESGVILGSMRRKASPMPDFRPDAGEQERTVVSRGDFLIEECWGDYMALLVSTNGDCCALRPPFGDLACVRTEFEGLHLLASRFDLLRHCTGDAVRPHWDMIANHMLTVGLRQPQSCLVGIEELLWGTRLIVGGSGARVEQCWSPWRFAAAREGAAFHELADMVRTTTAESVAAGLRSLNHVAVMLSGGLDSSILACCVAASGTRLTCVNLTSGDAVGDERTYAKRVALSLSAPLYDAEHRLDEADVARSEAAHLPRPIARSFAQAARAAKRGLAGSVGAEAILDGGGGDNIFCSLQSATPVADRLLRGAFASAVGTAADVAELTETGLAKVLSLGVRRALRRSRAYRWKRDSRFMNMSAIVRAGPARHEWLRAPQGALPGSAAHIAMIVVVEALLETADGDLPEWAPLMNQPLVELCLGIPSWNWFENGHNRAVARHAFAGDLPPEIIWRRSKGTPDGFVARLFETNRDRLRSLLCDGQLAAHGLLDIDAVVATIDKAGPVKGHDHIRLLRIADVEAWVRSLPSA